MKYKSICLANISQPKSAYNVAARLHTENFTEKCAERSRSNSKFLILLVWFTDMLTISMSATIVRKRLK